MFESLKEKFSGRPHSTPQKSATPSSDSDRQTLRQNIIDAIKTVYDPEIPVNVYDLGLIYDITINPDLQVSIQMTLTAPACPVAGILPGQVETVVQNVQGVSEASVELVWDPPWTQERISEEAQLTLGLL